LRHPKKPQQLGKQSGRLGFGACWGKGFAGRVTGNSEGPFGADGWDGAGAGFVCGFGGAVGASVALKYTLESLTRGSSLLPQYIRGEHHQFCTGINPGLNKFYPVHAATKPQSYIIAFPIAVYMTAYLGTMLFG
jgi:hypothetical protein